MAGELTDGREQFTYLVYKPRLQRLDIAPFVIIYSILSYLAFVSPIV